MTTHSTDPPRHVKRSAMRIAVPHSGTDHSHVWHAHTPHVSRGESPETTGLRPADTPATRRSGTKACRLGMAAFRWPALSPERGPHRSRPASKKLTATAQPDLPRYLLRAEPLARQERRARQRYSMLSRAPRKQCCR